MGDLNLSHPLNDGNLSKNFEELNDVFGTQISTGTALTSTVAELNILDGVTATAAELNKLDDSLVTLTTVDQTALFDVGRIHTAIDGKAYVYLEGVASCVTGSVVTYIVTTTGAATTALAIVSAIGHVGVAMAAVIAGDFGWFQIAGLNLVTQCDTSAAIGVAYIGGTTGGVDHTAVVGDRIDGMHITVADASNVCGVFMTYPGCSNTSN
jgi:hypothetical protein